MYYTECFDSLSFYCDLKFNECRVRIKSVNNIIKSKL